MKNKIDNINDSCDDVLDVECERNEEKRLTDELVNELHETIDQLMIDNGKKDRENMKLWDEHERFKINVFVVAFVIILSSVSYLVI